MNIHKTAIVDKNTKIGKNVTIDPYVIIGKNVEIGDNVSIKTGTVIHCNTKIGNGTKISSQSSLGGDPQDVSFNNEDETFLEIGENSDIREFVSINRGTKKDNRLTKIGDNCLVMSNAHIGHDCMIANDVIIASAVVLGGHCNLHNNVIVGGHSVMHHHTRVGRNVMIGGMVGVKKDIIPFSLITQLGYMRGPNFVGLKRMGMKKRDILAITKAINEIKDSKNIINDLGEKFLLSDNEYVKEIANFIQGESKLGFTR